MPQPNKPITPQGEVCHWDEFDAKMRDRFWLPEMQASLGQLSTAYFEIYVPGQKFTGVKFPAIIDHVKKGWLLDKVDYRLFDEDHQVFDETRGHFQTAMWQQPARGEIYDLAGRPVLTGFFHAQEEEPKWDWQAARPIQQFDYPLTHDSGPLVAV